MYKCNDCVGCESDETDGKIACSRFILREGKGIEAFKVGDKVRVSEGISIGKIGIISKIQIDEINTWIFLDKCNGHGYGINNIKLVEDKMQIKINRKAPMTEQEQVKALEKLMRQSESPKTIMTDKYYIDKAMEICKNEPQEVESVYIAVESSQVFPVGFAMKGIIFTLDQIRQIQAIKL